MNLFDISYLLTGSPIQQAGYTAIKNERVLELLHPFRPVLAGTLPLDLFIYGSDLDILCYAPDEKSFASHLEKSFSHHDEFLLRYKSINNIPATIATFKAYGFSFEIFGQNIPVTQQVAFRHLITEFEILQQKGETFRQQVIALKKNGMKTEPAFAKLLQLTGDPYEAMLQLGNSLK
jgi:hypothetical protein